ncbi:14852_t:CDS:2, partial [Cetraspora pellucida]
NVSSGNQDIDNLIKATHNNQPKFRLEWIPFEDFTDINQIGNGGFSEIYMATWTKGSIKSWSSIEKSHNRNKNQTVALKVLKDSKNINSAFLKELQNIVKSQPNSYMRRIIQCYGVSQFPKTNDYIFVMSYMSNGSLNDFLSKNFKDVTWRMKRDFLKDIATGIKWIHKNKIAHRDIHGGNILIGNLKSNGPDSNTLIADLGFSRPAKDDLESSECNIYGIMPYIAPEVLNKKQYSFSSDIYSLGMIMWELTKAEEKRQELLNAGKLIAKYIHPHSKTHSQLLNPTIDSMLLDLLQGSKSFILRPIDSFQSISSDSFNIISEHFKNANCLNSTINIPPSKKHSIEFLLDENNYNEIKRRKLSDSDLQSYALSLNDAIYQITILSNLNLNHDKLCYEAGNALSEALSEILSNNNTLTNLNLENNYLGDDAVMALAKALYKNTTLMCLNLYNNRFGGKAIKTLAEALCKNITLTNLDLRSNNL